MGAALAAILAGAAPAHVSLAASPAHVALAPGGRQLVHVTARGGETIQVRAGVLGFAFDLRGRPTIGESTPASRRLRVSPSVVTVGRHGADVTVTARRVPGTRAGDHSAVLLLTATAPTTGVRVRVRVGLIVTVRVPGPIVHELVIDDVRTRRSVRARWIEIVVANRGNIVELLDAQRIHATVLQGARVVARLRAGRRMVLPHARALFRLPVARGIRGRATLRVETTAEAPALRSIRLLL
ncbi:MAG TPA: hypothetical protein VM261_26010 [Kofleriaceae bacterium]|nr:hypothetical protein [Kofleriaceae bacterium]